MDSASGQPPEGRPRAIGNIAGLICLTVPICAVPVFAFIWLAYPSYSQQELPPSAIYIPSIVVACISVITCIGLMRRQRWAVVVSSVLALFPLAALALVGFAVGQIAALIMGGMEGSRSYGIRDHLCIIAGTALGGWLGLKIMLYIIRGLTSPEAKEWFDKRAS